MQPSSNMSDLHTHHEVTNESTNEPTNEAINEAANEASEIDQCK